VERMRLTSDDFADGSFIPERHAGSHDGASPALRWSGVPAGARSLALICDDPDAPGRRPFVHWLVADLPAEDGGLPEGVAPDAPPAALRGARQGRNGWGGLGYRGPSPPPGPPHRYRFRLIALDRRLGLPAGFTRDDLARAARGHVLAEAVLTGRYGQPPGR
jgi:Raf kinase inhibitor-like YbhB/YbcL family protein